MVSGLRPQSDHFLFFRAGLSQLSVLSHFGAQLKVFLLLLSGGGLGVASATGTTGKHNNEVLSLLTDSQVVPTSTKVQDTASTPKNLHYRLLFVSKKLIDTNRICGGVINSSVFAECVCAKEVHECTTGSHRVHKSKFLIPNTVYLVGTTSKNRLTNPKLLDPDRHAFAVTEQEDIPGALACIDIANTKLENVMEYESAEVEFASFKENQLISMKNRIFTEARERSDKKVKPETFSSVDKEIGGDLRSDMEIEHGRDDYGAIIGIEGSTELLDSRKKDSAREEGSKQIEVKNETDDYSFFSGSSLGSQVVSASGGDIEELTSEFATKFDSNPSQNAASLFTQNLLIARALERTDDKVGDHYQKFNDIIKEQGEMITMMNDARAASVQDMLLLRQEMRLLKRELKDTKRSIRKQSLHSPPMVAPKPEISSATVSKLIEKEVEMATQQLEESISVEIQEIISKEGTKVRSDQQSLESRISIIEGTLKSLNPGTRDLFGAQHSTSQESDFDDINNKLSSLDFEVTLMKSRLGERSLHFGSIDLPSEADTLLFVCDHLPIASYGCFFDFVALLDSLRDTQTTIAEYASQEHAAQKSKFLSTSEVSTSASFVHIAPLCFAGTKPESTGNYGTVEKSLPRIKDRHMWQDESGRFGLAKKLDREIQAKVTALEREIEANLGSSRGVELARKYLFASQKCWEKLFVWTEKFFQEMASVDKIEPAEAWTLVLDCWMAFFEDLRDVRVACSGVSIGQSELDSDERKQVVTRYIWTMGKAIYVQNEYVDADFNNHPTIARVINYHMFHNKVPKQAYLEDIEGIDKKLQDLYSWKGNAVRQLTKLENKTRTGGSS